MNNFKKSRVLLFITSLALVSTAYAADNQPPQGGKPPSVDKMFAQMDSNGDNQLSKNEVKGPLKDNFNTVDSNSDGYITKDELKNAPKPERGSRGRPPQPPQN